MKSALLSFTLVSALLSSGCEEPLHAVAERPAYEATRPLRQDVDIEKQYVAQVRAIQHIELRALERGYLQEIFVDEGQLVPAGKPMFQIMPLIYQAELRKAEAEAQYAEIEYQNTKLLADDNVVSPNELALSRASLDKANAELELARVHRGLTEIKAPFEGIMGRFNVRLGSLVEEGELLTTLSDNSRMWVYFNVSEAEYIEYQNRPPEHADLPLRLLLANGAFFDQPGRIETIEADFNNETGNIAFRASFPNPAGLLRHGQTGKVVMALPIHGALLIPQKATFEILDKRYLFVVDEAGVAHQREIRVAEELPYLFVVGSGLKGDEVILTDGLRKVRDGQAVETRIVEPQELISALGVYAE